METGKNGSYELAEQTESCASNQPRLDPVRQVESSDGWTWRGHVDSVLADRV